MAVTDADSDVVTVKWPLSALLRPLRSAGADGGRAASQAAVRAFERLAGALRRLRDLPLAVTDVQPIAAACRYTAEPPPKPLGAGVAPPVGAEPLRFVISLEGSGKWPTDADAVDAVRSALHVRICEKLREASGTGGFGPGEPPDAIVASADGIDILLDGFALRGSITYDEHLAVTRSAVAEAAAAAKEELDSGEIRESGADSGALARLKAATARAEDVARNCVAAPVLAAALRQTSLGSPAFAPCVRLAKRWVAAHLLSPHVTDETLEALAAIAAAVGSGNSSVLGIPDSERESGRGLLPSAYAPPRSATTAFLRLLATIAQTDWESGPLRTPLRVELPETWRSGALAASARAAAAAALAREKSAGPQPLVRLELSALTRAAGGIDVASLCCARAPATASPAVLAVMPSMLPGGGDETDGGKPARVTGRRLIRLAKATLADISAALAMGGAPAHTTISTPPAEGEAEVTSAAGAATQAVERAFTAALEEYDVLLHLAKSASRELSAHNGDGLTGFKNLDSLSAAADWPSRLATDRVGKLLRTLEAQFGHLAVFFLDRLNGQAIALRWKPTAFLPVPFRVNAAHAMIVLASSAGADAAQHSGKKAKREKEGEGAGMVPNVLELLQDMLDLGDGLIASAEPVR
mmetsp:Transcript_15056/g.35024  ORF Transcript_15056/g.35024 Transcript_15056/m.35024 type:complete len:642 (-) Transcript_15056:94-2019(-)